MSEHRSSEKGARFLAWLGGTLEHPHLGRRLAALAVLFTSPTLFIGFYLDDYVGRYAYSKLEGARRLFDVLGGGFGVADGNPNTTHWLIEQGYAPWWTYPKLLIKMFRPVSLVPHLIDFKGWPDNAFLMHAHSLLWFAALVLAATRFYRGVLGPLVGGLAAFLYAFDHTHGFAIGFICNRNALITVTFGLLALDQYHRSRTTGGVREAVLGLVAYATALLAGEMSLAAMGYLVAHALFVDEGKLARRAAALLPYFIVTVAWRAAYDAMGCGARYCGLYVDPGKEPAHFLGLLFQRGPVLLLGELFAPPAEFYMLSPELSHGILALSLVFVVALGVTLWPLLAKNRIARFWAAGMTFSIVPASTTHPSNRLLFYVSIGAMGLLAQLWELYAISLKDAALRGLAAFSQKFGSLLLLGHLLVSPLVLPLTACSVAFTSPINQAFADIGPDVGGREAVFVTAPDYYSVKLMPMERRFLGQPLPKHWRVLAYGPEPVRVRRTDARTLWVDYEGGLMSTPMFELYRDRRLAMKVGETVELEGLVIRVREVTADGRPKSAEFVFDRSVDLDDFRFFAWEKNHFVRFAPPAVGEASVLPAARIELGLR